MKEKRQEFPTPKETAWQKGVATSTLPGDRNAGSKLRILLSVDLCGGRFSSHLHLLIPLSPHHRPSRHFSFRSDECFRGAHPLCRLILSIQSSGPWRKISCSIRGLHGTNQGTFSVVSCCARRRDGLIGGRTSQSTSCGPV